jgi:hypothetical protein
MTFSFNSSVCVQKQLLACCVPTNAPPVRLDAEMGFYQPVPLPRAAEVTDRNDFTLILILGKAIFDEFGYMLRGGRVQICQHCDGIAGLRADAEVAVHAGRTSAVTETRNPAQHLLSETIRVLAPARRVHLPGGQQLGVMGIEQFVFFEGVRKPKQIPDRGIATARGCSAIREGIGVGLPGTRAASHVTN